MLRRLDAAGEAVKPSEALELLAFVRANWRLPTPADAEDVDAVLWPNELADVEYRDAELAIRRFGSAAFAPTLLQISNVARAEALFRSGSLELPAGEGVDFAEWKRTPEGQAAIEHAREAGVGVGGVSDLAEGIG